MEDFYFSLTLFILRIEQQFLTDNICPDFLFPLRYTIENSFLVFCFILYSSPYILIYKFVFV